MESAVLHLKYADLVGRAVAVLHRTQQPVREIAFSLKIQHRVHNVLHDFRAGNGAVLVHMADDPDGDIQLLCRVHKQIGALPHLGKAAGAGGDVLQMHGLDGVDDDDLRLAGCDGVADALGIRHRQQIELRRVHAKALRPQLDLLGGFLAGYIEHCVRLTEILADLEQQRALTDAGFSAQQDDRPPHQTAAQHPIQLPHTGVIAHIGGGVHVL